MGRDVTLNSRTSRGKRDAKEKRVSCLLAQLASTVEVRCQKGEEDESGVIVACEQVQQRRRIHQKETKGMNELKKC